MFNRRQFLKFIGAIGTSLVGLRLPLWRSQAALQSFAIPPTVQHITENTATLYFRISEHTQNGLVRVFLDSEMVREISFVTTDALRVQIVIDGLEPSTTYQYQVLIDGVELPMLDDTENWSNLQFSTPPYEFPIRLVAIGDTGFGDATTATLIDEMSKHDLDMVLHLGDVVYHMNEYNNDHFLNWARKYFKPFQPLLQKMPIYPSFGNHDLDEPTFLDGLPTYYWMFPPFNEDNHEGSRMWYSFDYNNIQFICLNSQLFYSYASLREEQEAWLDQKLARQDVLYSIVFFHVTPFNSGSTHQYDGVYVAEQWVPKFEAAKIPVILAGHAHLYERLLLNGVTYIVAGSGSNVLYSEGERLPFSQVLWRVASYPVVELYADHIHITTYDMQGNVLDETNITIS